MQKWLSYLDFIKWAIRKIKMKRMISSCSGALFRKYLHRPWCRWEVPLGQKERERAWSTALDIRTNFYTTFFIIISDILRFPQCHFRLIIFLPPFSWVLYVFVFTMLYIYVSNLYIYLWFFFFFFYSQRTITDNNFLI